MTDDAAPRTTYRTRILGEAKGPTGIEVPAAELAALGTSKKPPVRVTLNGYTYRSTVATVDGRYMIGVSSQHRAASGRAAGDEVDVEIELDTEPREVTVPAELAAALDAEPKARETFDKLSNSNKGYHVSLIEGAKSEETRQRRIEKSVAVLREGKPR